MCGNNRGGLSHAQSDRRARFPVKSPPKIVRGTGGGLLINCDQKKCIKLELPPPPKKYPHTQKNKTKQKFITDLLAINSRFNIMFNG